MLPLPRLGSECHLLIGLARAMTAHLDGHFPVEALEKIEQLVGREPAEMPVHQVRHVRLGNPENARDLALLQLLVFHDFEDVKADLRPRQKLVSVFQPQIGEDVAGTFLKLNAFTLLPAHAPTPVLPGTAPGKKVTLFGMDIQAFQDSLQRDEPPPGVDSALTALWWDAKGDWTRAHESAQQDEGPRGAWVHAYLHRKEGDASNAAYWYRRAGKPPAQVPVAHEWLEIATSFLAP
jgi:hypothetical protein